MTSGKRVGGANVGDPGHANRRLETALVVPCAGRASDLVIMQLVQTLAEQKNAEVVVVRVCRLKDERQTKRKVGAYRCVYIPLNFNKSLAVNVGVALTTASTIVVIESGYVVSRHCLLGLRKSASSGAVATIRSVSLYNKRRVRPVESRVEEIAHTIRIACEEGLYGEVETERLNLYCRSVSGPGLFSVTRESFLAVEGMHSRVAGDGWENVDFLLRLQLAKGLRRIEYGRAKLIDKGDGISSSPEPGSEYLVGQSRSAANYSQGNFAGTFSEDARAWLGRLPEDQTISPQK
jgi:hypothetical protein